MVKTDRIKKNGETYTRHFASVVDRMVVGWDIGQSVDPSAISVIHHRRDPIADDWKVIRHPNGGGHLKQNSIETFQCRHLQRLPLGMLYPQQILFVQDLMTREKLRDADLVIDQTGVGAAVGDQVEMAGLRPIRVTITAGLNVSEERTRHWHVAKSVLVSTLHARSHAGELQFAAGLSEAAAMKNELQNFIASGSTYGARVGQHDDMVLSVAIALWWCTKAEVAIGAFPVKGHY